MYAKIKIMLLKTDFKNNTFVDIQKSAMFSWMLLCKRKQTTYILNVVYFIRL